MGITFSSARLHGGDCNKVQDLHGCAEGVDRFIRVVKETNTMHIVPIGAKVGPADLVGENAALGGFDIVWLVNNHLDLDTYWSEY
jgi:hypothetical protein